MVDVSAAGEPSQAFAMRLLTERKVATVAGIESITADAKFVADFKAKTAAYEAGWAKDAEAKGLKNAAAVLKELRAEIDKLK